MATQTIGGIAGIWMDEHQVVEAARKVKEAGYKNFEVITPYPVHGMEEACGIKRSSIPYVTFTAGLIGLFSGLLLTWWTSAVNWPLNIGGKPTFSLPAFIPIMFEVTILFAALSSVVALFVHCKMPKLNVPVIDPDLTCHKFAIVIPENEQGYEVSKVEQLMKSLGASETKKVSEF